jgi:dienelactone hydrolase
LLFDGELHGDTISGKVPSPTGGHTDPFYLKRKPSAPLQYKEEEIRFQSGGVTLVGTLRVPLAKGRHPALFIMQGSGAVDRDGEWFYADHFTRHGIVTLVYDKRGTGSSGGDYRDESMNDYAAEALAGIHYLQSRSEVNPKRVGLYGRSHGGIVAPLAASLSNDVAFIINVSGAGVPPYQQVTYQAEAQMRRDGFAETDIAEAIAYMNLKWEVARTGGEGWDRLQAATQNARDKKWFDRVQPVTKLKDIVPSWKLEMNYDPMPALEKVKCPVLAIFGELDTLTPVAETKANYQKGLERAGNKNLTIKVFPNADHALLVWPKPDDQSHWPVLAAGYLDTMTNWIDKHGTARR